MLIKHESNQIWTSRENVLSLQYEGETRRFPLFLASKTAKTTSKVVKISSNIGETTSKIFSPTLYVINFTSNFALKISKFGAKTKKMHFFKQAKEQRIFDRVQSTTTIRMALLLTCLLVNLFTKMYRVQLPSGWCRSRSPCRPVLMQHTNRAKRNDNTADAVEATSCLLTYNQKVRRS